MAIHDIDKTSDDRGNPRPNTKDQLPREVIMGKNTQSTTHINDVTSPTGQRVQMLNSQLLGLDSQNNASILFGADSTGTMVMKSVTPNQGLDARTASDSQLNFNSAQNAFKIIESGSITFPSTGTYTFTHNLGYEPIAIAYATYSWNSGPNTTIQLPFVSPGGTPGIWTIQWYINFVVTTTQIEFLVNSSLSLSGTIKYYILQETAN